MSKRITVFCVAALFVLVGLSQAGLSKRQPTVTPKAEPAHDFPEWYYEKFGETLYFADFEDGLLPAGWEIADQTSGMNLQTTDLPYPGTHVQKTTLNAYAGNSYYWGFIAPGGEYGYDNLWEDWILSPEIEIPSGGDDVTLTFMHAFNTESETDPIWDGHAVWLRANGGDWEQIHPLETDAYYDSLTAQELHCWGDSPGWTGERDWMQATFDLNAYKGQTIEFNILCVSDQLSSYDDGYTGVWVDEISVDQGGNNIFYDDAGDTGPAQMILTGSNRGANWTVTSENTPLKVNPSYDPGMYSLLGPEDNTCLSYYITTPWFTMPETGYPRSSFYRMVEMPGFDPEDDNLLNDLCYVEFTTDGVIWEILFNMYGSGDNDSTFELIDWNDQQGMKYHAYRGQDIRLRFKVHADETQETGDGCDWPFPCAGRGLFLDDFLMFWLGVPQNDIGIAYIDVPYPLSEGRSVDVHIGVMNLGSTDNDNAVTFYEILDTDTNWVTERFEVGDPLPGFPAPMGPPYPAIAAGDTFDFVYDWTPGTAGSYFWRALYFLPDELPEDDSLTVPTRIRVFPSGTGEIGYIDRFVVGGSVPGFTAGNGPAVRFDIPEEFTTGVALNAIRHDWTGSWSPYEVHIYGPGPNDSTWGEELIESFVFGDDEPEPQFPETDAVIDLTTRPDYENLEGLTGSVWIHLRALANTNLQIVQRGDALEPGHDWLYFQGDLVRNTQAWDMFLLIDWRGPGCVGLRGDPTGDGSVNVLDVLADVNHILGIQELTGDAYCRGDCNADGTINVLDALGIVNQILGIADCAPATCKAELTPEVMEFLKSLESYLSAEDFARFMALVKAEVGVPAQYSLAQNYPNPFNPTTTISFTIPSTEHRAKSGEQRAESGEYALRTTLKVYNLLGQEVATLVDEAKKPGFYTVSWDASDWASGVYFYRLVAGEYSATRRMVLLK